MAVVGQAQTSVDKLELDPCAASDEAEPNEPWVNMEEEPTKAFHHDKDEEEEPSLDDIKRALQQNFRATGVIDDVTVRIR